MTTPWDTWVPLIVSFAALAILIIVLSTGSILVQQWYAGHQARKHNRSHETRKDDSHKQSDPVARATQAIANNFSSYKQQQSLHHRANIRLQWITILFIFVTAAIALWQGYEMHEAGRDTNSLANATVRLSTNNRAWVFLLYDGRLDIGISDPTQRTIVPHVHFALHNYGNSPAIIKSVEPHMFYIPLGNPTQVFPERPTGELDPRSPSDRRWRETWVPSVIEENPHPLWGVPFVTDPGAPVSREFAVNQVVIPANGEINVLTDFWFQNVVPGPQFPQEGQAYFWPHQGHDNLRGDSWFFCDVHYTDVYGVDGETGYYAKLGIIGTEQPSEQYNRYNFVR
jgi:hypothetical protein